MRAINFEGSNVVVKKAEGQIPALLVRNVDENKHTIESVWKPTPAEIAALQAGACVVVRMIGAVHPHVSLSVEEKTEKQ